MAFPDHPQLDLRQLTATASLETAWLGPNTPAHAVTWRDMAVVKPSAPLQVPPHNSVQPLAGACLSGWSRQSDMFE